MGFENPITFQTLVDLLVAILNVFIIVLVPIIIFFLILAGFKYVTAKGKPEQIQEASRALMYGIIGGVVIVGAVAIMRIVKNLVDSF